MIIYIDEFSHQVIRHYHGHLSAVYSMALHPTLDILLTAGRDATARVWDMRSKVNIHTLTGHTNTVSSVICSQYEPQVMTFFVYWFLETAIYLATYFWYIAFVKRICKFNFFFKNIIWDDLKNACMLNKNNFLIKNSSGDSLLEI